MFSPPGLHKASSTPEPPCVGLWSRAAQKVAELALPLRRRVMNRRLWALLFGMSLMAMSCRSTGPAPPPPGQPAPVVSPVPTVVPSVAMPEATAAPASAPAAAPPAALAPALTVVAPPRPYQDILKLKQAGLSDEFLLNKIHADNVPYQLT